MKPIAKAYQVSGEAVWEQYKKALDNADADLALELKVIALIMAREAEKHCDIPPSQHKELSNDLKQKIKNIAHLSLVNP